MNCTAYCWASGLIQFTTPVRTPRVPSGALPLITGPRQRVHDLLNAAARHGLGKSNGKLLVPGIPEADNATEQLNALRAFRARLNACLNSNKEAA
jgi:hypothetical protein